MDEKVCPKCGSSNVNFNGVSLTNECVKCNYKWISSSLEEISKKEQREFFRNLDKDSFDMY